MDPLYFYISLPTNALLWIVNTGFLKEKDDVRAVVSCQRASKGIIIEGGKRNGEGGRQLANA